MDMAIDEPGYYDQPRQIYQSAGLTQAVGSADSCNACSLNADGVSACKISVSYAIPNLQVYQCLWLSRHPLIVWAGISKVTYPDEKQLPTTITLP